MEPWKTRDVLMKLGFKEDWSAITDMQPGYYYDFGNLRLTAAQVVNRYFVPIFYFGGVVTGYRQIREIEFEALLEVESFEQGVALIAYGIGWDFMPLKPTPWLALGQEWQDTLPWIREQKAYMARPQCTVERDWFRVAKRKLLELVTKANENDLAFVRFDGEMLRICLCGQIIPMPATGKEWDEQYTINAKELDSLPKRLKNDLICVSIWENRLNMGNRCWNLVHPVTQ